MARGDNLKKYWFQKGQSGNPNGRPIEGDAAYRLKHYTREYVAEVLNTIMELKDSEIEEILLNPEGTQFEKVVAKVLLTARKDGDFSQLERLLDRCIGKVPQRLEGDPDRPLFGGFSELLKKAHPDASGGAK